MTGTSLKRRVNLFIKNYFEQTSLHGFHYIVDSKNSIKTASWCLICFVCMAFCFYLIYIQLVRFTTNVTNTSITSTGYPVWENPFPAVTVCNNHIIYKNKTEKISEILKGGGFDDEQINKFYSQLSLLVLCTSCPAAHAEPGDMDIYAKMFITLQNAEYSVSRLMKELAPPCDATLKKCIWKSKEIPCNELFQLVKTSNGYCCSFNYYGSKEVQQIDVDEEELRYFTGGSGIPFGLKVIINLDISKFITNMDNNDGFEVVVRDGYDYPDMKMVSNTLLIGDVLTVGLYPSILRSHPDVRTVKPSLRECWFTNEGNLDSSFIYSFQTCLSECKAQAIYDFCKCVPFIFPLTKPKRVCTLADAQCLMENELKYNSLVLTNSLSAATLKKLDKRVGNAYRCHCLTTCDEIRYENFVEKNHVEEYEKQNMSILNVFYNSIACTKRTRNVIVTWDMLLASIGGIFGLCLGGSVLSLIELLYHIVDALFGTIKVEDETKNSTPPARNDMVVPSRNGGKTLYNNNLTMQGNIFDSNYYPQKNTFQTKKKHNLDGFVAMTFRQ